jgi:hypothetical protein
MKNMRYRGIALGLFFAAALFLFSGGLHAEPPYNYAVTLKWDPNPETDIAGYRVYHGNLPRELLNYPYTRDAGLNTRVVFEEILPETPYFFAVTARNVAGLESAYSNEVGFKVPRIEMVSMGWAGASTIFKFRINKVRGDFQTLYSIEYTDTFWAWIEVPTIPSLITVDKGDGTEDAEYSIVVPGDFERPHFFRLKMTLPRE